MTKRHDSETSEPSRRLHRLSDTRLLLVLSAIVAAIWAAYLIIAPEPVVNPERSIDENISEEALSTPTPNNDF